MKRVSCGGTGKFYLSLIFKLVFLVIKLMLNDTDRVSSAIPYICVGATAVCDIRPQYV